MPLTDPRAPSLVPPPHPPSRTLDVIILTPQPLPAPALPHPAYDFRCSAFKGTTTRISETEVDPLEESASEPQCSPRGEAVAQLRQRVLLLERRVRELEEMERELEGGKWTEGRKRRRKFADIERSIEVVSL